MAQEPARPSGMPETPLSVSFRDSAFMNFVNEATAFDGTLPHQSTAQHNQRNPVSSATHHIAHPNSSRASPLRPPPLVGKTNETPTQPPKRTLNDGTPGSTDKQHSGQPASLAPSNNNHTGLGASADEDGDWGELDNMELDSQVMRQLLETEESFYSTQRHLDSASMLLSQEFAEARIEESDNRQANAGSRAAKSTRAMSAPETAATRSAPVTPAGGQPIYISSVKSSGRPSPDTGTADSSASHRHQQQHPAKAHSNRVSAATREKVNLYPRLAQHIPPPHTAGKHTSLHPPQSGQYGKLAIEARDVSSHSIVSQRPSQQPQRLQQQQAPLYHQQQTQRFKPYSHSFSGGPGPQLDLGSSTLAPTASPKPIRSSNSSGHGIAVPETVAALDELARLRAENERMRAETEQLRAQLYTKEGEVKIVRENLARTEIDNTHLQEQLTSHITSAVAHQQQSEKHLQAEIERLKTELVFQQHEAQAEAMAKAQSGRITNTPRSIARSGQDARGSGLGVTTHSGTSSPMTYPNMEDFMAVPRTLHKPAVPESPISTSNGHPLSAVSRVSEQNPGAGDSGTDSEANTAAMLDILSGIAKQPNKGFGSLVMLSVELSRAVRDPKPKALDKFHLSTCNMLREACAAREFEQLGAIAQLLLQVVNTLVEFRTAWLFGAAEDCRGCDRVTKHSSTAKADMCRMGLFVAAAKLALDESTSAASMTRSNSAESAVCSAATASLCRLLVRVINLQPAAALSSDLWADRNPCDLGALFTPGLGLDGLLGVVGLLTTLIQVSPASWELMRSNPSDFERLLLATMRRLQMAFVAKDALMLDGKREFLVLIASAIVTHEDDTPALINSMRRFTTAMVQWFLEEHLALTRAPVPDRERRVQVFFEYIKCLNVVLSEVKDVVLLLGGDNSPLFYGFVATCTRMALGESVFASIASIRELAADLLAYAVTEDQAISIQNLDNSGQELLETRRSAYGLASVGRRRALAMFDDRIQAGEQLAHNLREYANDPSVVVMSVSRGGAVIGSVVASTLGRRVPHVYYVVRTIPCASMPRLSLGSVSGDGSVRIDNTVARSMGVDVAGGPMMRSIEAISAQLSREQSAFCGPVATAELLAGKTLLVVDDGMEAGDTMREAVMHLRHCYGASRVVVAAPVCPADLRKQLNRHAESVVDIVSPVFVGSVARWYALGTAVSDSERRLLDRIFVDGCCCFDDE
ncbi:hypothetical protein GGI02_000514 [Coemansia sp. RSA 2322]|nr:hypothetical protein GGI02_000514 [Coemansia sp. RSA 2322]